MPFLGTIGLVVALASSPIPPALAEESPAARGAAVIERWCRTCHARAGEEAGADAAPSFEAIVRRPGRTPAYLRAFLDEDHFPMTTYRLFDHEKDDVAAYLNGLR